ncbi:MAG: hypothetical protein GC160_10235 [Acidobacteria bacterium]|nr:hypothetical protein [Acidobacteriota bacterium]
MADRRKYRRKERTVVAAVQLDLETEGFTYQKWGGSQKCKAGDWLVLNAGETYTVDQQTFAETYRPVSLGVYEKVAGVWAVEASDAGSVPTKEGSTDYEAGDFLVSNKPDGGDSYAMSAEKFHSLYEPAD